MIWFWFCFRRVEWLMFWCFWGVIWLWLLIYEGNVGAFCVLFTVFVTLEGLVITAIMTFQKTFFFSFFFFFFSFFFFFFSFLLIKWFFDVIVLIKCLMLWWWYIIYASCSNCLLCFFFWTLNTTCWFWTLKTLYFLIMFLYCQFSSCYRLFIFFFLLWNFVTMWFCWFWTLKTVFFFFFFFFGFLILQGLMWKRFHIGTCWLILVEAWIN